jgi:serine/threonine protein kinase
VYPTGVERSRRRPGGWGDRAGEIFVKRCTSQIVSALAAAHAKNIIHRDLKPDNVMLVRDPDIAGGERIKLVDFGVAKLVAADSPNRTKTGFVLGTPTYMAPQQCRGPTYVDGRSDLYSLGCMRYKMACGRAPFDEGSPVAVLSAHLYTPPPSPRSIEPTIPAPVEALLLRLLQKDPNARYSSARALLFAMRSLLPEGSAYKHAPNVSPIAKTIPFTTASELMAETRQPAKAARASSRGL